MFQSVFMQSTPYKRACVYRAVSRNGRTLRDCLPRDIFLSVKMTSRRTELTSVVQSLIAMDVEDEENQLFYASSI